MTDVASSQTCYQKFLRGALRPPAAPFVFLLHFLFLPGFSGHREGGERQFTARNLTPWREVSRAQILLQGGSLIITRIVHHGTIKMILDRSGQHTFT